MNNTALLPTLILVSSVSCTTPADIDEGFLEVNGTTLYYKSIGSGEPIVVLHGGPGFDHQQFLPYIGELSSRYKVILYDQRGTGLSSGPADATSITIHNFVEDIEGIRTAFGIAKMNLLGHSWGGMLAMHYAVRHPDKLKSLILCSTAATAESFDVMRAVIARNRQPEDTALLESIIESQEFKDRDPRALERFWRIYFKAYFVDPALAAGMTLSFTDNTRRNSDAVARYILDSVGAFDLHEDLGVVRAPTLILHGDSDPMPVVYAERIHESIPNSELVIAESSGHWIFIDATDRFRSSVFDFLSRVVDP
jgi:proline iminopeptidase